MRDGGGSHLPRVVLLLASALLASALPLPSAVAPAGGPCAPVAIDVMILLDASGSMGGEIDQLRIGIQSLVAEIQADHDAQFGLIVFGFLPEGEDPMRTDGSADPALVVPLSTSTLAMQARLNALSANGFWEPWGDAIHLLNAQTSWRPGAQRLALLITDEPHDAGRHVPGPLGRTTGEDYDGPALYEEFFLAHGNEIRISAIDAATFTTAGHELTTAQLLALTRITGGEYRQFRHGTPGLIDLVHDMIERGPAGSYRAAEATSLLLHVDAPVNPAVSVSATSLAQAGDVSVPASAQETLLALDEPLTASFARIAESYSALPAPGSESAYAEANLTRVSLLGGLVTADVIHVRASVETSGATSNAGSFVHDLRIAGMAPLASPPPGRIDIPGVGTLHILPTTTRGGEHPAILQEGLRLEVRQPELRATLVLGQAAAHLGCAPALPPLTLWRDDDARSGADAGGDAASALLVPTPALVTGRIGFDGDAADAYRFASRGPGEGVAIALKPSERAVVDLDPMPTAPALIAGYAIESVRELSFTPLAVELIDPFGVVQERHETDATQPVAFEFNPHVGGDWLARVVHGDGGPVNYTLALVPYPLARLDGEGTLGASDAAPACGSGAPIQPGAHAGALYGGDVADALAFDVELGEAIAVTMKPSENADGARFDLELYDPACALRGASTWDPSLPEGAPRAIVHPAADQAGAWTARVVRRTDAVGNWHLTLALAQPMAALLAPDGGTGADAGGTPATALASGNGVDQGALGVGDDVDCYRTNAAFSDVVVAAVVPGAGLDVRLRLIAPDGQTRASSLPASSPETAAFMSAQTPGAYAACVERVSGGGQYTISFAAQERPRP